MSSLAAYLKSRVPDGMDYRCSAQLCLRLYCTVNGVPNELLPLTKEALGDVFAALARDGWVHEDELIYSVILGAHLHEVTDRGHWVEVIGSIFKKGPGVIDMDLGARLARQVGFVSTIV